MGFEGCGLIGGVEWSERGFWCFLMEIKSWLYGILIQNHYINYFENLLRMCQRIGEYQQHHNCNKRQNYTTKYKEKTDHSHNAPLYALPLNNIKHKHQRQSNLKQSDSFETCESENHSADRNLSMPRRSNIKVELCKNFVEKGYCPYENRCRFAHGIQQLRAKDTHKNSQLYRTRKCKIFYEKHECRFGQRCNFMHESREINTIIQSNADRVRQALRNHFQQINFLLYENRVKQSRLLGLLAEQRK